jgi:hypothetical protein
MQKKSSYLRQTAKHVLTLVRQISQKDKRKEVLAHYFSKTPTVPHVIVSDIEADEKDIEYADRLLQAYHRAIGQYNAPGYDLWTINTGHQSKFLTLLNERDPVKLAQYLCNMNKEDATIGTVQGNYEYDRILKYPSYKKFLALMAKDKLASLAEAVGALPIENPEQGYYGKNIHEPAEVLFDKICSSIGYDITPPDIDGGLLKIIAGKALFNERDCNAIYTGQIVKSAAKVCEIGGGAGRVCYWSMKFGVADYTLLDLPHINVVQGFYLLKSLFGQVSLYGEPDNAVKIRPCHLLPEETFDLILNQDSFPEIGKETVISYLHWIRNHCREFLSINHESKPPFLGGQHINVFELTREVGNFERIERMPYWLRKGYALERYRPLP